MKLITREWLESAELDLENIRHILSDERLTGHVAFHAQQAIEKSLKAIIEENGFIVPKIHSIQKLLKICKPYVEFTPDNEMIIALDSLYLDSRYPGEFGLLADGKPDLLRARKFFEYAVEINRIIKHILV
jgi:HEPN domain-containing protein